jgi:hypothetical protein
MRRVKRLSHSEVLLFRILICTVLIGICFFALAAMLGQLDSILSSWYLNPKNIWEMPLPIIFNQKISALLGWEIIYAIITVCAVAVLATGVYLGWNLKSFARREAPIPIANENLWEEFRDRLPDIELLS